MTKKRLPYIKWFPSDFAGATRGWPFVARALYRELIDAQWDMNGLPADETSLRRITGLDSDDIWNTAWPFVQPKFELGDDGRLRNVRLERLRTEAAGTKEMLSESGKRGAEARWGKKPQPSDDEDLPSF